MGKAASLANIGSIADSSLGFRNRIINPAMVIDQRNAGASITQSTADQWPVDRFRIVGNVASKFTAQQNAGSVTPPTGFTNYLGITSTSAYTVGAGEYFLVSQAIEGFNFADMGWGTASAATITLSFWIRSSLTGTFGGVLKNNAATRSYPFTYTISSANTWEQKTITVAGDTTGTWVGATNGMGLNVFFGLGVGSTYSGTAGAWAGANYVSATGATSVVGTNGATFYITGVQLEKGSTATSFDYRPYSTELQLAQRYYEVQTIGGGDVLLYAASAASNIFIGTYTYAVPKRSSTSATIISGPTYSNGSNLVILPEQTLARHRMTSSAAGYYGANIYSVGYSSEL